jgi:hypothetical protein
MRTITFDTKVHDGVIKIPARYKNLETKEIEVTLVLREPGTEKAKKTEKKVKSARGILSKYKNPALIPREKQAWEQAVKEKYDHR